MDRVFYLSGSFGKLDCTDINIFLQRNKEFKVTHIQPIIETVAGTSPKSGSFGAIISVSDSQEK